MMIGAIIGDIIGSVYEFDENKPSVNFKPLFHTRCRFTDDSVHTVALAESILRNVPYNALLKEYYNRFPNVGYGKMFRRWAMLSSNAPYNSWGNGSAMRTSPVGWAYSTAKETTIKATEYASGTHNHPLGIKGAVAVSVAIWMLRNGMDTVDVMKKMKSKYYSNIDKLNFDDLVKNYTFDVSCEGTVPVALYILSIGTSFEDCIRKAVAVGGDTDTLCAIVGSMAEAKFDIPTKIYDFAMKTITPGMRDIVNEFREKYIV